MRLLQLPSSSWFGAFRILLRSFIHSTSLRRSRGRIEDADEDASKTEASDDEDDENLRGHIELIDLNGDGILELIDLTGEELGHANIPQEARRRLC